MPRMNTPPEETIVKPQVKMYCQDFLSGRGQTLNRRSKSLSLIGFPLLDHSYCCFLTRLKPFPAGLLDGNERELDA